VGFEPTVRLHAQRFSRLLECLIDSKCQQIIAIKSTDCLEFFAAAYTGLLLFFFSKCLLNPTLSFT